MVKGPKSMVNNFVDFIFTYSSKALKSGGTKVDISVAEPEVGNVSQIMLTLSQK